jgi:hypothetical protein
MLKSASPEVAYFLLKQAALPTGFFGNIGREVIRGLGRLGGSGKITGAPARGLRNFAYGGPNAAVPMPRAVNASAMAESNKFLKADRARQVQEEMAKRLAIVGGGALGAAGAGAAGAGYLGYKALGGGAEPDAVPAND